jgi:hypothetical protein
VDSIGKTVQLSCQLAATLSLASDVFAASARANPPTSVAALADQQPSPSIAIASSASVLATRAESSTRKIAPDYALLQLVQVGENLYVHRKILDLFA